jgi:hypothetical protein
MIIFISKTYNNSKKPMNYFGTYANGNARFTINAVQGQANDYPSTIT